MRTIKLTNGADLLLDGDLLTILETFYRELTQGELEPTFEDTVREIRHVIDQMNDKERKEYLSESLFLNYVSYENQRLAKFVENLTRTKKEEPAGRGRAK